MAVSLNPRLRLRFVRTIVTTLFLSLFATFPVVSPLQSASASTTITKTVTIKGSTDALYSGAEVSVIYFLDGDGQETKRPIQTTGSNGQVTISYPINASYAQMFITPPSSDTTHAVHTVDLLTSTDAAISNVKLKVSNLRIKTTLPSGGDSGQYTCVDYPKVPSSRWVTTQYRTTRAGAFGLAIPTTLNTIRDYHIVVSPCNSSDYNYLAKNYGLRMASNKAITLYSDDTFKSTLTASSNVYSLAFDQGKVRGQILDSNGAPFTIPAATYLYLSATPLATDGSIDETREQVWSWQITPDNKFSFQSGFQEGRYKVSVYSYGADPIASFEAGDIWVDSSLKYSTTSGGTYTTSLDLTYNIPNTGLTKFRFVDTSGNPYLSKGYINLQYASSNNKQKPISFYSNANGIAIGKIPDGNYSISAAPENSYGLGSKYTFSVESGVGTLKNADNQTVPKVGEFFPIKVPTDNLRIKMVSPYDTSVAMIAANGELATADGQSNIGGFWSETTTSVSRLNLSSGSYVFEINPYSTGVALARNIFTIDVDSSTIVVKNGNTVIQPTNGIYLLEAKKPLVTGQVLDPTGVEAIRWADIRAVNSTNPKFQFWASTNAAGDFSLDFGSPAVDGLYYITATPPIGVNANVGQSESVTVRVTNGVPDVSTLNIRLRVANFSGTVSGPTGPASQNWLMVQESRTGTYQDPTIDGPLTDEDGGYSLYLPTGAYGITPSSDYANTGGVSDGPKACSVGANASVAVTCNISLVAPNVSGTITLAGEKPLQSMVGFAPLGSDPVAAKKFGAKYGGTLWSGWSDINNYGLKVESGTYRMWIAYQTYTYEESTVPGQICVVPATGTVTCDATLPAANLKIQVADWNGNAIRGAVSAAIQYKDGSNYFWTCCANSDSQLRDGKIQVGLINGSYKLLLNSTENTNDGVAQTYYFDVSGSNITNMRLTESGTTISSSAGEYTLRLKEPIISGVVRGVDGTTPKPYVEVRIYNAAGSEINSTRSDRLGRFAYEWDEVLANGTYFAMASIFQSLTEGNSKFESFTILNGKATSSITLKLNTPNVIGTASGPLGVSRGSFINVQSVSGSAFFSNQYTFTDQNGKFAFYLPTGSYRFWGNTDFESTGGVQGNSETCVVNAETTTAITCNLVFAAPTVSGTITNSNVRASNSYILFFPAYGITGNTATNAYGWIYASNGKFGINADPGTYRSFTLSYSKDGNSTVLPGPLCTVPTTGTVICNITRGSPNFSFKARSPSNEDLSNNYTFTVEVKNGDQYQSADSTGVIAGSTPTLFLFNGNYRLTINPRSAGTADGTPVGYTFNVVNGVVENLQNTDSTTVILPVSGVYQLKTTTPNVQGLVSGPKGVGAGIWIEVSQVVTNGKGVFQRVVTDKSGRFALRLPVGIYLLKARPDFASTGGGDTTVRCEVISETATAVTCNIALAAPNVTGTVRVGGVVPSWGSITLRPAQGVAGNTATETYWWSGLNDGQYGINAKPGTYRTVLSIPAGDSNQMTQAGLCVVPESGTATCNVNVPTVNFVMSLLDPSGVALSSGAIDIGPLNGDAWDSLCCNEIDSRTKQKAFSLIDGNYQIRVFQWSKGGSQNYLLTVESGTVKSLKAQGSNIEVLAVNGVYPLRLKPPTFMGTVYKPNGTTPAPNVYVVAESNRGGWGTWTDSEGKFSIDIASSITDAIFTFRAEPNRQTYNSGINLDRTIARANQRIESVTAGAGSQSVSLILNAPTVSGRVTGPKAALINRDITFQKLDGAGNWNWTNIYAYTDKSGDFVEYLPAGTYRIYAWGDTKGAGGGETYGNSCVISAESGTATTCNLSLAAPNVSGTAKYNGVVISWGDVQFEPDYAIKTNTPRRGYGTNVDQGYFGQTIQADTYQTSIWFQLNGKYVRVFGPKCVVPETGTVTCDINLPAINLSYKVFDTNNVLLTSNVYSSLEKKSGDTWNWTCCSYPDTNLRDGKFETTMTDGEYRLGVRPDNASIPGSTQLYTFIVESGTVKNFVKQGTTETVTVVNGVYSTKLRPAALTGSVFKSDGVTPYSDARICARDTNQGWKGWRICTYSNSAGKFTLEQNNVNDGIWIIQAFAGGNDITQGSSTQDSVTVTSGIGSKVLTLNLRTPTVTGVVSGPKGVSSNNYLNVRQYFDNGSYDYIDTYFVTDAQGRFAFTLEPGRYRIQAQNDMANAGGTAAISSDCIVTSGSNQVCNIALQVPNVIGTVKIAGQAVSASVELLRETIYGFDGAGYSSGTNQSGGYWLTVTPGTYRSRIYLYSTGSYIVGPECVVQLGVNSTCDINLPATNLQFRVRTASGANLTSGVNTYLEYTKENKGIWAGSKNSDTTGLFKHSLVDGKYRLTVAPNGTDASIGTRLVYFVTVDSNTVTSIIREGSTTAEPSAVAGIFTLSLGVPSISGNVVAPDGTTPVPNARVYAFNNPWWGYQAWADQNASYGFEKLPDGTYSVIAAPTWGDATKAPSAPTEIKIVNGAGANELKLTLRTPNVTGVVRGTTGKVSRNNWIYVEQKMNGGWWQRPDYYVDNMTSVEGSYALYLEPGIYRIRAQSDMNGAGGVASAVICTVQSGANSACNITLKTPNFKMRIVAPNTTTFNKGSGAYTYLRSSNNEDAILNRNPNFEWDQNGNYQAVFEDGTWTVVTQGGDNPLYSNTEFTVEVNSGVITKVTNAQGETLTATGGTYLLPLIGSNLTGTIRFNGVQYEGGAYAQVLRQEGDYWYQYSAKWTNSGTFGFSLPAGNYKIEVAPYWNNQGITVATTRSALCTVETSGSTTCDVALKAPNFKGKILNAVGSEAYRFSEAYILLQSNKGEQWVRWLNLSEGQFDTYLEDGRYRIQVMPRWDKRSEYTDRSYVVLVESGTVLGVVDQTNGIPLSPSPEARYSLLLGTPAAKGRVFLPDQTTGVPYANIQVAPSQSPKFWRYSTQADANGNFALTIPNGTYVIQAVPTNGGFQYGKSETRTVVISGGVLSNLDSITLLLRNPNLTGRIVTPGLNPQPLANVNVNINVDGEYFYAWTDGEGRFGAYVDNPNPNCAGTSNCSVRLNYFKGSEYTPKQYTISALGSQGDLAIGGVTTRLTVKIPQVGSSDLPSKYSWINVESVALNGTRSWVTNGNTDENGVVGLALDTGVKYWIWAYPNGEQSNGFAPKKIEISSFSPETHSALSLTFDLPNVRLRVISSDSTNNSFGWYTVETRDSITATTAKYSNAYLDGKGLSALTLANGDYQLRFWPGKDASGVQKVVIIRVNGSTITRIDTNTVTGDSLSGTLLTLKLPGGNVSGIVQSAPGVGVASAMVAAYLESDQSKFVTTSTDSNGYYQLNLDLSSRWIIKAVDPLTNNFGQLPATSVQSTSNEVLSALNVLLAPVP